ncbi:heavy metal-associated isoprenylated plant protein 6-like [Salvia miltiorrhiza]|uniref:heavy metal-associated isoprenylated plant protein 6-like n=1 Tax=Salvia miltiorrhiza TaxID=226208 RepID=UPI0025AB7380|nr:heavy metal-associated isoprenylated plant protein 6-like [Salvia miltiorrhiza]
MGEKVEKKNEVEKNAAAEGAVEKAAEGGGGEKKVAPMAVVLKMDLHCQGCAKKVRRSVRNLEGVETVKADCDAKKLTVTGNVDPAWLREKVEIKTKKKVELISPQPKNDAGSGGAAAATDDKKAEEKKGEEDKPKKTAVSTVTMKTKLHCDGCAHKIKRIIIKNFDGVDSLTTDLQKDLIIAIGTMNVNDLVSYLREKLKRGVEIVPPKKDKDAAAAVDSKEKASGGGEQEKKDKESDVVGKGGGKQKQASGDAKEAEAKPAAAGAGGETKVEMSKMEHHSSYNPQTHYAMPMVMHNQSYGHQEYGMHHHQSHTNMGYYEAGPPMPPPTYLNTNTNDDMFSDENPNGCSVM